MSKIPPVTPRTLKKWGNVPKCPACKSIFRKNKKLKISREGKKSVYPLEQVYAADRKPFHKGCIKCAMDGCRCDDNCENMRRV